MPGERKFVVKHLRGALPLPFATLPPSFLPTAVRNFLLLRLASSCVSGARRLFFTVWHLGGRHSSLAFATCANTTDRLPGLRNKRKANKILNGAPQRRSNMDINVTINEPSLWASIYSVDVLRFDDNSYNNLRIIMALTHWRCVKTPTSASFLPMLSRRYFVLLQSRYRVSGSVRTTAMRYNFSADWTEKRETTWYLVLISDIRIS